MKMYQYVKVQNNDKMRQMSDFECTIRNNIFLINFYHAL